MKTVSIRYFNRKGSLFDTPYDVSMMKMGLNDGDDDDDDDEKAE